MSWIQEQAQRASDRAKIWAGRTIVNYLNHYYAHEDGADVDSVQTAIETRKLYADRWAYYNNRDLYQRVRLGLQMRGYTNAKGLINPVYSVVEFYADHLWPGDLPDALPVVFPEMKEKPAVKQAIHQIWEWSNFAQKKQVAARRLAIFGDMFIKVAGRSSEDSDKVSSVFMQMIRPAYVQDFFVDERGYLTWIRIDVPQRVTENGHPVDYVNVEIYDKAAGTRRSWRIPKAQYPSHVYSDRRPSPDLEPNRDEDLMDTYGIDFVPVVHVPCIDVGNKHGSTPFDAQLDKIDHLNKSVHRLGQIMFAHDKPVLAVASNTVGPDGRPIPAPMVSNNISGEFAEEQLGRWTVMRLPGNTKAEWLIPPIKFDGQLAYVNLLIEEMQQRLPEYQLERMQSTGQLAAETAEILLSRAESRLIEVRGNAERGLQRAHKMALTIAQNAGLDGFSKTKIGTFETGDFDHSFTARRVFVTSAVTKSTTTKELYSAGVPTRLAILMAGWGDDFVQRYDDEKAREETRDRETMAQAIARSQQTFDSGQQDDGLTRPESSSSSAETAKENDELDETDE